MTDNRTLDAARWLDPKERELTRENIARHPDWQFPYKSILPLLDALDAAHPVSDKAGAGLDAAIRTVRQYGESIGWAGGAGDAVAEVLALLEAAATPATQPETVSGAIIAEGPRSDTATFQPATQPDAAPATEQQWHVHDDGESITTHRVEEPCSAPATQPCECWARIRATLDTGEPAGRADR